MNFRHTARRLTLIALMCAGLAPHAFADTWPNKPVKIIVPYGPGGAVDIVTRNFAELCAQKFGVFGVGHAQGKCRKYWLNCEKVGD